VSVNAEAPIKAEIRPRWQRKLSVAYRRMRIMPLIEIGTVVALIGIAAASYFMVLSHGSPQRLLRPPIVAALLVANLVPAMALMVLIARRVAMRRAARSPVGGRGRLHVRLVALFSALASIPTLLVVIFASLLFQQGMQFWFSDKANTVLSSAENVSQIYEKEHRTRIALDVQVMGGDVVDRINEFGILSENFRDAFLYQTAARQLTETAVLTIDKQGRVRSEVEVNFDKRPILSRFSPAVLRSLKAGEVRLGSGP